MNLFVEQKTRKKGSSSGGTLVYCKSKLKGRVHGSFLKKCCGLKFRKKSCVMNRSAWQVLLIALSTQVCEKGRWQCFRHSSTPINYFPSPDVLIIGCGFNRVIGNQPDFII